MRFENQVVLITGGASGIGFATGQAFAAEGARVVLADLSADLTEKAAAQVGGSQAARALTVDVGDHASVQALIDGVVGDLGRLDVLVACAGIARRTPLLETPDADWHDTIRVNLTGVYFSGLAVARQMVKQRSGRIVNIASINSFRGVGGMVAYNASKAGVVAITRTMAVELARHGINVNAIAPGPIETPMTANFTPAQRALRQERVPLDRFGKPEEIAQAACYLASDVAGYITGHVLAVDGGYLAGGTWEKA